MNLPDIIKFVIDLLAVLLLALGIKGLSKVRSAREANILAAFAMLLSVVGLLSYYLGTSGIPAQSWAWIIVGSLVGSLLGTLLAKKVPMTSMPETVALFNGFGGMSSLLVAIGAFLFPFNQVAKAGSLEPFINDASIQFQYLLVRLLFQAQSWQWLNYKVGCPPPDGLRLKLGIL